MINVFSVSVTFIILIICGKDPNFILVFKCVLGESIAIKAMVITRSM